jgi:DNA-binding response OmpR family regulator
VPPERENRILIVDDDMLILWALGKEFAALNFSTHVAESGAGALEALRQHPIDYLFLDVNLPDGDGIELLPEIRRTAPDTKIIVMSADAGESARQRAFAGGAMQFLEKPFDLSEIHGILKSTLGTHAHKRKYPRHICRIPLNVSIVEPTTEEAQFDLNNLNGTAADFGFGGMRLHIGYPLRVGQHLRTRAHTESDHFRRFVPSDSSAEVVWVAPAQDGVMAGLKFVN